MIRCSKFALFFVLSVCVFGCKKNTLNTKAAIKKYHLQEFTNWDSEGTPFGENITLCINKQTDSCLVVLKNKAGDTILTYLDNSIVNAIMFKYRNIGGDWIVVRKDYGHTTYSDSLGDINYESKSGRYPANQYFRIDRETRSLQPIKISPEEISTQLAKKFRFLKGAKMVAANEISTYFFKDTLTDHQQLYDVPTDYKVKKKSGRYFLEPLFGHPSQYALLKNKAFTEPAYEPLIFGEKVFDGSNAHDFHFRYEIGSNQYYHFEPKIAAYNNTPGMQLFKVEICIDDWKKKWHKKIAIAPKDRLFTDLPIVFQLQRNGKIEVGIDTQMDHQRAFYYELDTIAWQLKKPE